MAYRRSAHRGFTLVELLVVIAIIGILVAMLLPAIQAAREAARRSQCINRMKQMALATLNYENARKELPKLYTWIPGNTNALKPDHGFHIYLLPYMEYQPVYDTYDFKTAWYSANNSKKAAATDIPDFICPTAPPSGDRSIEDSRRDPPGSFTDYAVDGRIAPSGVCLIKAMGVKDRPDWSGLFTGVVEYKDDHPGCPSGSLQKQTGKTTLKQTVDGLSHTVLYCEDAGRPDKYEDGVLKPADPLVTGSRWASPDTEFWTDDFCGNSFINCHNGNEIYSFHSGGAMFAFGDGSVHFVPEDTDIEIQTSLITRAGEDTVTTFE